MRALRYVARGRKRCRQSLWHRVPQQADFAASESDYRAGYLSIVAEVAQAYFQIRQFDEQIVAQDPAKRLVPAATKSALP
mgnify:CR=1 FL=1